jgi:hypothetical protein
MNNSTASRATFRLIRHNAVALRAFKLKKSLTELGQIVNLTANLTRPLLPLLHAGRWLYGAVGCRRFQEIRTHESREARPQLHDGYSANETGEYSTLANLFCNYLRQPRASVIEFRETRNFKVVNSIKTSNSRPFPVEERRGKCAARDVAYLQTHKACEASERRTGANASAEIPVGHLRVSIARSQRCGGKFGSSHGGAVGYCRDFLSACLLTGLKSRRTLKTKNA